MEFFFYDKYSPEFVHTRKYTWKYLSILQFFTLYWIYTKNSINRFPSSKIIKRPKLLEETKIYWHQQKAENQMNITSYYYQMKLLPYFSYKKIPTISSEYSDEMTVRILLQLYCTIIYESSVNIQRQNITNKLKHAAGPTPHEVQSLDPLNKGK